MKKKKTRPYRRLKERLELIRIADRLLASGARSKDVMRVLRVRSPVTLTMWRRENRAR